MTYQIRPAQRAHAKPLIGLYGESGSGKTYSALLLARGFVGPEGRICMIETESGRGEAYADPTEYPEIGGYDVVSMRDDFSPAAYGQAIKAVENAGVDALIIDSASHEWEGAGGVLAMAAQNQAGGKKGPIVWQQPKILHQREFMLRFMQTAIPLVILCMRAKYPMREVEIKGKKQWVRSEDLHPKQADDILYEMFIHGWLDMQHRLHVNRCTAKGLQPVFITGQPLSLETGQQMKAWASGSAPPAKGNGKDRDLQAEAKEAAEQGADAFRAFWAGLSKADRTNLKPDVPRYKDIATKADSQPDEPEDPFAEDQAEETPDAPEPPAPGQGAPPAADGEKPHPRLLSMSAEFQDARSPEAVEQIIEAEKQSGNWGYIPEAVQAEITALASARVEELTR